MESLYALIYTRLRRDDCFHEQIFQGLTFFRQVANILAAVVN
jgi:hypothetical protein